MAEPVIDVSSVTIFPTNLPCGVYGDIYAYDKLDSTLPPHQLYRQDAEHAELISESGQALSLIDLDKILFMQQPAMTLILKVKDSRAVDDAFIALGTVHLDVETNNDYEVVKQSHVGEDIGHVTVNYVALSCALVARITIRLSNYQTIGQQLNSCLFGSIVAHYGKTFGRTDHLRISLLSVPSDKPIPLFFEEDYPTPTIKLARNYVAVPAYSSLTIKANLRPTLSSMPVVDEKDTVILWPSNWRASSKFEPNEITKRCLDVFNTWTSWEELFDLKPSQQTKRKSVVWGGEILFEVFSVFIGRENNHDLNVSGTITLQYFDSELVIFKRDESNPDKLLDGRKLLTITCPSSPEFWSASLLFTISVKLKDADQRFLIEEGFVDFNTTVIDDLESQFDRPLCSVLRGDGGYCAVHYTMFKSAARVNLKIVLLCRGLDVVRVHGKIVAWSDIFDYTRDYNRRYYQRVLYDEPTDKIHYPRKVAPKKHGEVDLSESCVAVPVDFYFTIDFDLYASSLTGSDPPENLRGTFSFQYVEDKQKEVNMRFGDFDIRIQIF